VDQAPVGERRHRQADQAVQRGAAVERRGEQLAGLGQESRPLRARLGVGARGLLDGQQPVPLLGQALALGDVDHETAEALGGAGVVDDRLHDVGDPHEAAIGGGHPVLQPALAAGDRMLAEGGDGGLAVVGVDEACPRRGVAQPVPRRMAEQALRAVADEGQRQGRGIGLPHDGVEPVHQTGEARVRLLGTAVLAAVLDRGRRTRGQLVRDRQVGGGVRRAVRADQREGAHDVSRAGQGHYHRGARAEAVGQKVQVLGADQPPPLRLRHLGHDLGLAAGQHVGQRGRDVGAGQRPGLQRAGEVLAAGIGVGDGETAKLAVLAHHVDRAPVGQRPGHEAGETGEGHRVVERRRQDPAGLGEQPGLLQRLLGFAARVLLAPELFGLLALAPLDVGDVAQDEAAHGAAGHLHPRDRRVQRELRAVAAESDQAVRPGPARSGQTAVSPFQVSVDQGQEAL
jgi:hypothetical protein